MIEALALPFFQRVVLAGLLASVACGVVGTYVVARRMSSMSGGLAHAAFGGVGLGYFLGFDPMLGAVGFGLAAGAVCALAYRRIGSGLDTLVSMVWAVGMALGIVFIALTPGYAPDLTTYLFGNLLWVSWDYVAVVAGLDLLILVVVWRYHRAFQALCFDEEFAEVSGLPVERLFLLLVALVALSIVTLIRVVGVILAIALLTIPAVVARQWRGTLPGMMAVASLLCGGCVLGGLFGSYWLSASRGLEIPPGPLVILIAAALYGLSSALRRRALPG
ncbi:MAG: metal ABC transporter permease [Myxococcota bacterium]